MESKQTVVTAPRLPRSLTETLELAEKNTESALLTLRRNSFDRRVSAVRIENRSCYLLTVVLTLVFLVTLGGDAALPWGDLGALSKQLFAALGPGFIAGYVLSRFVGGFWFRRVCKAQGWLPSPTEIDAAIALRANAAVLAGRFGAMAADHEAWSVAAAARRAAAPAPEAPQG